jgi:hypothetical protein
MLDAGLLQNVALRLVLPLRRFNDVLQTFVDRTDSESRGHPGRVREQATS